MMRRPLTTLTLAATCAALVLGAALAVAIGEAGTRAGASRADAASGERTWPLSMSAAPDDLALAEVSFGRAARGQGISARSLQVAVRAPFGDDYLLAAAPRLRAAGVPRVLVLLVNRPSALLDPVFVHLRLSARRALGAPRVRTLVDPFTRSAAAHAPALCNLALHGAALSASQVRPLYSRGSALAGFDAASALAQAYDVVCGLPHAASFEQAVEGSPAPPSPISPGPPAPSPSPPAPSPPPPVGKLPGEGCVPAPGYACPAAVESAPRAAVPDG